MKPLYKSMYAQMAYVIVAGLGLLLVPNLLIGIFGFEPTNEIWIRIMGLLVSVLGFYYYYMAHYGNHKVVWATVLGRLVFCSGLVVFVLLGMAKPALIGFAVVESAFALWSWKEIKG
jgi:hypothetical protein